MSRLIQMAFKCYSLADLFWFELEDDIGFFVRPLPGVLGFWARYLAYKPLCKRIASCPYIFPNVRIAYMRRLSLGRSVKLNVNIFIDARGGVDIGDDVLIGPNSVLASGEHDIAGDVLISGQASHGRPIRIGTGAWIGANCVIRGGVTIGEHCVIGAGSVVTKDTDAYGIYAGAPAKKLRDRRDPLPQATQTPSKECHE